jgi:predicted MFS family arabinose efflux permease
MIVQTTFEDGSIHREASVWGAVFALTLCVATLIAICFISSGSSVPAVAVLLAAWGLIGAPAPAGRWTWLSKMLPNDTEQR